MGSNLKENLKAIQAGLIIGVCILILGTLTLWMIFK
jgi:hypothetical protein